MIDADRIDRLLEEEGLDLLVASTVENVFYASGVYCVASRGLGEASFCLWSADAGGPHLVLPAREGSAIVDTGAAPRSVYAFGGSNIYASDDLTADDRRVLGIQEAGSFDDPLEALATAIEELAGGPHVALERSGFDPDGYRRVETALAGCELRPARDLFYRLRTVKTDEEVRRLRRAAQITESSMAEATAATEPGTTERELAADFRRRVGAKGGEPLEGFLTVGFGRRTAYTHPLPGDREVREGDLIRWDGGCTYENYCADIGRTYAFRSAEPTHIRTYEALYGGLEAALGSLADGVDIDAVYAAGVEAVRSSGVASLSRFDPFHLGHGIGVEIYDPPRIVPGGGRLRTGMVLCVEPPYNELGRGGYLIEDEVVVTADGHERLTRAEPTLPVIG